MGLRHGDATISLRSNQANPHRLFEAAWVFEMSDEIKHAPELHNRPMSYQDARDLTVEDGRLYWKGKLVKTKSYLELDWIQNTIAVVVAVSTLSIAIFDILRFFGWGVKS